MPTPVVPQPDGARVPAGLVGLVLDPPRVVGSRLDAGAARTGSGVALPGMFLDRIRAPGHHASPPEGLAERTHLTHDSRNRVGRHQDVRATPPPLALCRWCNESGGIVDSPKSPQVKPEVCRNFSNSLKI